MKIKASELLSAYEVLLKSLRERRDEQVRLPTKAAYRIARLTSLLEPEYLALTKTRLDLVKQHGEESKERPGFWGVLPGHEAAYDEAWRAVADEVLEVACQPMPLSALGEGASYFTVAELMLLGALIQEDA